MAWRWRIRHKLMLGLGLVVSIIALLLAGTVYGLTKFRATARNTERKIAELREAERFKHAIQTLTDRIANNNGTSEDLRKLDEALQAARVILGAYEERLHESLSYSQNPNQGFHESSLVQFLRQTLGVLESRIQRLRRQATAEPVAGSQWLSDDRSIKNFMSELEVASTDLGDEIYKALGQRLRESKGNSQLTLWIVFSTSIAGILLLGCLLRFFYQWVFAPIRALEAGAGQVAQGNFESPIEVHSGDELEDLAGAFNEMTSRLRDMYGDLASQVNERSRQLVRSERLAGVGFLAAGVAHEINNPLASIAFCSEALEARLGALLSRSPEDSEVITKYLRMIQQEAFRCKAITQRLLEFSRGGERRREPCDLVELVQAVLDMVQHLPNCKGKQIIFQPTERLTAWINGQEIKSVVLNLVANALDSMDEGGMLRIFLRRRNEMAELTFTDTGCGMSAEILENIFEPFFTRSRTGKGTGLGLSISHRVISQHGGEIEASSPGPDQGSTFTVRLPLQSTELNKEETIGHAAA